MGHTTGRIEDRFVTIEHRWGPFHWTSMWKTYEQKMYERVLKAHGVLEDSENSFHNVDGHSYPMIAACTEACRRRPIRLHSTHYNRTNKHDKNF